MRDEGKGSTQLEQEAREEGGGSCAGKNERWAELKVCTSN